MPIKDRDQRRAYNRQWLQARKDAYFTGRLCFFCGSDLVNPVIHHLDPSTKESHRIWSWSDARRKVELAKCVPACADCHTQYHASQRRTHEHGTAGMYKHGCHCTACRRWNAERRARQRIYQNISKGG